MRTLIQPAELNGLKLLLPCLSRIKFLNLVRHGSSATFGTGLISLIKRDVIKISPIQETNYSTSNLTNKPDGSNGGGSPSGGIPISGGNPWGGGPPIPGIGGIPGGGIPGGAPSGW